MRTSKKTLWINITIIALSILTALSVIFADYEYKKAHADEVTDYSGEFYFERSSVLARRAEKFYTLTFHFYITESLFNQANNVVYLSLEKGAEKFSLTSQNLTLTDSFGSGWDGVLMFEITAKTNFAGINVPVQIRATLDVVGQEVKAFSETHSLAEMWATHLSQTGVEANFPNLVNAMKNGVYVVDNGLDVLAPCLTYIYTDMGAGVGVQTANAFKDEKVVYRAIVDISAGVESFVATISNSGVQVKFYIQDDVFYVKNIAGTVDIANSVSMFRVGSYYYFKFNDIQAIQKAMGAGWKCELQSSVVGLSVATISTLDEYAEELLAENKRLKDEKEALLEQLSYLEYEKGLLNQQLIKLNARIDLIEKENADLLLQGIVDSETIANLNAELEELKKAKAELEETETNLNARIEELNSIIEDNNGSLYSLWQKEKTEKETIKKELEELKATNAELEKQLNSKGEGIEIEGGCDSSINSASMLALVLIALVGVIITIKVRGNEERK